MSWQQILLFSLEIVGTVVFSVSGGLVAIERGLDFFGIVVLSVTTAVGGGMVRDLILGETPPAMFLNPAYVFAALVSAFLLIILLHLRGDYVRNGAFVTYMGLITFFDAVGLGIFTVVGMNNAFNSGFEDRAFLCIFVGVLTGIGGGILRDVLVHRTPLVLRREIYALASISGAVVYYYMRLWVDDSFSMIVGAVIVVGIRLLSVRFKWNLPNYVGVGS